MLFSWPTLIVLRCFTVSPASSTDHNTHIWMIILRIHKLSQVPSAYKTWSRCVSHTQQKRIFSHRGSQHQRFDTCLEFIYGFLKKCRWALQGSIFNEKCVVLVAQSLLKLVACCFDVVRSRKGNCYNTKKTADSFSSSQDYWQNDNNFKKQSSH